MLFIVDIVNLLLKKQWEETQKASLYFLDLECSGCQWVSGGGLELKFKDRGCGVSCLYCFG